MSWVEMTPVEAIPKDSGRRFDIAGHRVAVFRVGDDVYAIGDRCSHAEASLAEGDLFDTEVECPRHGSAFDLTTGEPNALPATKPVPTYEVKVEDGIVMLHVEDR